MSTKDLSGIGIVKKNETTKHCCEADYNFRWDKNKVADKESRLILRKIKETIHYQENQRNYTFLGKSKKLYILRKIKETIHSPNNPNQINKVSYMLREIWLPNIQQFHIRRF